MAQGLNVVGERWALLVVRELLLGPKRFTDLRADLPGISPNVLTQRLDELEERAVVRRRRLPPPAAVWVYELTEWGAELEPVIVQLGRWGARSPFLDRDAGLSCTSVILSMRTMFRPEAARGLRLRLGLRLAERAFLAVVEDGALDLRPVENLPDGDGDGDGAGPGATVTVTATPELLAGLLYDGVELAGALASGQVQVDGDVEVLRRYLSCFWLPEQALAAVTAPLA